MNFIRLLIFKIIFVILVCAMFGPSTWTMKLDDNSSESEEEGPNKSWNSNSSEEEEREENCDGGNINDYKKKVEENLKKLETDKFLMNIVHEAMNIKLLEVIHIGDFKTVQKCLLYKVDPNMMDGNTTVLGIASSGCWLTKTLLNFFLNMQLIQI